MRNILFALLLILTFSISFSFVSDDVRAENGYILEQNDYQDLEMEILSNSIVDTAEDEAADIWEEVKSTMSTIFSTIVGALLAPFRAFETLTENWAESLSSWYAPILAGAVLIILLVMWRGFSLLDKIIDTTS